MSRTVLLSEVDEVAERYPGCVPELRGVLAEAGLAEGGEQALTVVADRMAGDVAFREGLHACVDAMCAREPQISHLEVVGLLVIAVAGAEGAAALEDHAAVRTLFSFVLAWRRRGREASAAKVTGPSGGTRRVAPEREAAGAPREPAFDRGRVTGFQREAVAGAGVAEGSGMLARALALAADEDADAGSEAVRGERGVDWVPVQADEAPRRRVRPLREPLNSRTAVPELGAEDEAAEVAPRRWGMWTAVTCGVLVGFGLGAFAHFDHRSVPVATGSVTSAGPKPAGGEPARREKSIGELEAEIAALDATANLSPSGEAARGKQPSERVRPAGAPRVAARRAEAIPADARAYRRAISVVRSPAGGRSASSRDSGSAVASSSAGNVAPASLPVTGNSGGLRAASAPASALLHAVATVPLPLVTTGSAGIMAANLVSSPAPAYPVAASSAGVQGEVVVEAVVGRNGDVVETRVVSGPPMLRAAALDAVGRWRYRPYEVDGKPIEVATTARLEFRLDR